MPDEDAYESPFFLSYARARESSPAAGDPDEYVEKFFHDLAENVGELISPPTRTPVGFMDREMRGGMWWTDELMRAVGSCQVLIVLLSARYLQSKWCHMEWHAFSLREVCGRPGRPAVPNQGCIVPVVWAPLHADLPDHISPRLIWSPTREPDPAVPLHYEENGIVGLMRMGLPKNSYEIVAWQLAKHIAEIYYNQRAEPRVFDLAELQNAVQGGAYDQR